MACKRMFPLRLLSMAAALAIVFSGLGCSDSEPVEEQTVGAQPAAPGPSSDDTAEPATVAKEPDPWLRLGRVSHWTGDFDGMVERGFMRILTVHSPTHYFVDGARERGIVAEFAPVLEKYLNRKLKPKGKRISVVVIPVRRDQLLPFIVDGHGDMAAANLTITPDRLKMVDFSEPSNQDVQELVVTGPAGPKISGVQDLSGHEIWVRASSSYYESLGILNEEFRAARKPEIVIREADENLETEDILEMVNAGLIPATVMDSHELDLLWSKVFTDITINRDVAIRTKGNIAVAVRKNSPQLLEIFNDFMSSHKVGTEFGNVVLNRYMGSNRWVQNANATGERQKYLALVNLFEKYADQYDFDHLMLIAQGYQESRLDQSTRSPAGAVGVMQILPTTAAASPVSISDIENVESNIHAGVKYLRHVSDEYFDDPAIDPVNRMLFAFAAYNAGPTRISRLRRQAVDYDLDPNQWFREVEFVVQRKVGMEPVNYVRNIYKYYIAYKRVRDLQLEQEAAVGEFRDQQVEND